MTPNGPASPWLSVVVWGWRHPHELTQVLSALESQVESGTGRAEVVIVGSERDLSDAGDVLGAGNGVVVRTRDAEACPWRLGYETSSGDHVLFVGRGIVTGGFFAALRPLLDDSCVVVPVADAGRGTVPGRDLASEELARHSGRLAPLRVLLGAVPGPVGWSVPRGTLAAAVATAPMPRERRSHQLSVVDEVAWIEALRDLASVVVAPLDRGLVVRLQHAGRSAVESRRREVAIRTELTRDLLAAGRRGHPAVHLQATRLHDLLAADPDQHAEVVAGLRGTTVGDFPFEVLNGGLGRDLVVSYLFPPSTETSGLVAARRVRAAGRVVDVIAADPPADVRRDPSGLEVAASLVAKVMTVPGPALPLREWAPLEEFVLRGADLVARSELAQGRYHTVYSRSMPPASHALAALLKVRRPALPWTAEFSDPLTFDTKGRRRAGRVPDTALSRELRQALDARGVPAAATRTVFELVEMLVLELADHVVFTNVNQRAVMLQRVDPGLAARVRVRSRIVAHPTPDAELYSLVPSTYDLADDVVNIGYFGTFFAARGFDDLAGALRMLDPPDRRRIVLHVFTSEPERTREAVEGAGLRDHVRVSPYISYLDFLALAKRLDLLVVTDSRMREIIGMNPYLPSKVSDYLGSGTPVWALVDEGSPMDQMPDLFRTRLGDGPAAVALLRRVLVDFSARWASDESAT